MSKIIILDGQNWSKWTKLDKVGQYGQSWTKWTKLVKMDKVGQNGQELIQMDKVGQNGQSWTKWTKLDKMDKTKKMKKRPTLWKFHKRHLFFENSSFCSRFSPK